MCQGFSHLSGFLHHFVLTKLATSSIRLRYHSKCEFVCFSHRWSKVNSLAKQKEALMEEKKLESMDTEENDSDLDEADYEEFLDWRSKAAWTQ